MAQKHILIVDDTPFPASIIKKRLEEASHTVDLAENGAEALEALKEKIADVVLLDLAMPVMSGFEFLEVASEDPSLANIPIIVLSNLAQEEDKEKTKKRATKHLGKTELSIDEIIAAIQEVLDAS